MTDQICAVAQNSGMASYRIVLLVNNVEVHGRTLERRHPINIRDIASHAGHARCHLKPNDKIEIWVIPDENGRKYRIPIGRASMTVSRVRQFD